MRLTRLERYRIACALRGEANAWLRTNTATGLTMYENLTRLQRRVTRILRSR